MSSDFLLRLLSCRGSGKTKRWAEQQSAGTGQNWRQLWHRRSSHCQKTPSVWWVREYRCLSGCRTASVQWEAAETQLPQLSPPPSQQHSAFEHTSLWNGDYLEDKEWRESIPKWWNGSNKLTLHKTAEKWRQLIDLHHYVSTASHSILEAIVPPRSLGSDWNMEF